MKYYLTGKEIDLNVEFETLEEAQKLMAEWIHDDFVEYGTEPEYMEYYIVDEDRNVVDSSTWLNEEDTAILRARRAVEWERDRVERKADMEAFIAAHPVKKGARNQ